MRHFIIYVFLGALVLTGAVPAWGQTGRSGMSASEIRRQTRLFDEHIVRMGETGFSIARGYAISPETLAEDNKGVDLSNVKAGQVLLIRKKERGRTEPAQVAREWNAITARAAVDAARQATEQQAAQGTAQTGVPPADTLGSGLGDMSGWMTYPGWGSSRRPGLRDFSMGGSPHIAMLLPLNSAGANLTYFTDFYKGALVALEELKAQGRSAGITLYNSENSVDKVREIVSSAGFADTDLVIGPVYENEMEPAVMFGETFGVPVVSPLATLRELDSETLWQMAPDAASKYDKLQPLLESDANIIVISSGSSADDAEFEREITGLLEGRNHGRFTVGNGNVVSLLDWGRPNVLIVLAGSELSVNMALATISSSYNLAVATRPGRPSVTVIGTSRWANYNSGVSLDQNLLFKLNTRFLTNYHIDRGDRETRLFEMRYLEVYGDFPTKSAFRGYDAVAMFVGALFESGATFGERLGRVGNTPLGTPYRFVQSGGYIGRHVNDQWSLVTFSNDFSIITQ